MANGSGISGFQLGKGRDEDEEEFGPSRPPSVPSGAPQQRSKERGDQLKTTVKLSDEIAQAIFDALEDREFSTYFSEKYRKDVAESIADTIRYTLEEMAGSPNLGQSISDSIRRAIDWQERAVPKKNVSTTVHAIQTAIKNTTKGKKINFPPNP